LRSEEVEWCKVFMEIEEFRASVTRDEPPAGRRRTETGRVVVARFHRHIFASGCTRRRFDNGSGTFAVRVVSNSA
jgi:hypothetical protein